MKTPDNGIFTDMLYLNHNSYCVYFLLLFMIFLSNCDFNIQETNSLTVNPIPQQTTYNNYSKKNLAWSTQGSMIAYSATTSRSKLIEVNFEGIVLSEFAIFNTNTIFELNNQMVLSPDLQNIVFRDEGRGYLWIGNLQSGIVRLLTPDHQYAFEPAWSPDGNWIAYTIDDVQGRVLWIISTDGEKSQQITSRRFDILSPTWSPDGNQIAFYNRSFLEQGIHLITIGAQNTQKIVPDSLQSLPPVSWSPDGTQIAFISRQDSLYKIMTIAVNDSTNQTLIDELNYVEYMAWSPDGSKLLFISQRVPAIFNITEKQVTPLAFQASRLIWHWSGNSFIRSQSSRFEIIEAISLLDSTTIPITEPTDGQRDDFPVWMSENEILFTRRLAGSSLSQIWYKDLKNDVEEPIEEKEFPGVRKNNLHFDINHNRLLFDDGDGTIYLMAMKDRSTTRLQASEELASPSFSPAGDKVACINKNGFIILKIIDNNLIKDHQVKGIWRRAVWSPTETNFGSFIALETYFERLDVFTLNDLKNQSSVTHGEYPTWSHGNSKLAYVHDNNIFVIEPILTYSPD